MADRVSITRLVIVGAGGFGREVLDVVDAVNRADLNFEVVGFVDDHPGDAELVEARGARILDGFEDERIGDAGYVVAIGDPIARGEMADRAAAAGLEPVQVVHPSTSFGFGNQLGAGLVACAHVSVTTGITIGRHVHLNLNATVGHDSVIGDQVTVYPGVNISGDVRIGDGCSLGTGAAVLQGVSIGAGTFVGAGSVVTRDLPDHVVAFGAPARAMHENG